jgi:flagellar basal body-associated protein FliL
MNIKETALKFWKPIVALAAALFGVFVYTQAKKSESQVAAKQDSKAQVDVAVEALKPETEAAVAEIHKADQEVSQEQPKYHAADKDLNQVVEDYNKL